MIVKLLTEHHLEFLSLIGGCRGSSESTHVKMSHCWNSISGCMNIKCMHKINVTIQEHPRLTLADCIIPVQTYQKL